MQLVGLTLEELTEIVQENNFPKFYAKELARWIYQKKVNSFDAMTNFSQAARKTLSENYSIGFTAPSDCHTSTDGTKKYLFPAGINQFIEAAYIPDSKRHTLCVSSQVGCKMGCTFCMTARQGFQNQLPARDILNQILNIPESDKLTNIVFMGMGEPFDNIKQVLKSLEIITSAYGLGMSPRRITVSTIGIVPGMRNFIENSNCHLAISLHSPFDDERGQLIPMQRNYPIKEIIAILRSYDMERQRRISFEYIVFKDVNDSAKHVKEMARLLSGLRCRINLIPFHAIPDSDLKPAPRTTLEFFKSQLERKGFITTIRASRGEDIMAACGLLSTKEKNKEKNTSIRQSS